MNVLIHCCLQTPRVISRVLHKQGEKVVLCILPHSLTDECLLFAKMDSSSPTLQLHLSTLVGEQDVWQIIQRQTDFVAQNGSSSVFPPVSLLGCLRHPNNAVLCTATTPTPSLISACKQEMPNVLESLPVCPAFPALCKEPTHLWKVKGQWQDHCMPVLQA